MHAFLVIGGTDKEKTRKREEIIKDSGLTPTFIKTESKTIEEIRGIKHLLSRAAPKDSLRVVEIDNISSLTLPASNAFLKILEEPPENTIFILYNETFSVLATIASRSQIIELSQKHDPDEEGMQVAKGFFKENFEEKMKRVEDIKNREEARVFCQNLLSGIYPIFKGDPSEKNAQIIREIMASQKDIELNLNVKLVLTNLILKIPNTT